MKYLQISRPRFWHYLAGPWVIGLLSGLVAGGQLPGLPLILFWFFWWLLPSSFFLYAVNDLYDYKVDLHDPKKQALKAILLPSQHALIRGLCILYIFFTLIAVALLADGGIAFLGFIVLGAMYSMPPVRLKGRPLLDLFAFALYCMPALHGFALTARELPNTTFVIAGLLWWMATHAFSSIPDIAYDKKTGLTTTATTLGKTGTLLLCTLLYSITCLLIAPWSLLMSILGLLYPLLCLALLMTQKAPERLYRWFPYINMAMGLILAITLLTEIMV